ncbi:AAA family ATPase [Neobacillus sp. PS3-34]|uniref:AAA family ATPase n=1 Tax=Neobacillus sp. PS3-34 TaxID=3070678 RepID=UPI0027E12577|nr:AAA family ATPase [Neobacillus sp. PS3-34]WML49214.1 AAA family ATPase [Neobacillus sp. PS3-34]
MEKSWCPTKIHIIGSVGSGKTTLARELSSKLNVPFFELDNIVWKRFGNGDIRRSPEERNAHLNNIIKLDAWIIEGVHHEWVLDSFQNADLIIFLDTDYLKRTVRIIKRFILQKIGVEKANYKPTIKMFRKMFEWNAYFENISKSKILKVLMPFQDKLLLIKDRVELEKYLLYRKKEIEGDVHDKNK